MSDDLIKTEDDINPPDFIESDLNFRNTGVDPDEILPQGKERQAWGGKAEFLFSCLSYAVGLGNVWRFPYLCYENGGGAFLLPFAIMLFCVGIPLMHLETCLGQYTATGPITAWKVCPLFSGIGWTMWFITFSGSIYYNMLVAWTLFYFWKSITSITVDLPWTTCSEEWNTGDCLHVRSLSERNRCQKTAGFYSFAHNHTCLLPNNASWSMENSDGSLRYEQPSNNSDDGYRYAPLYNEALDLNATNATLLHNFLGSIPKPKTSSDEYFHNFVLSISNGFHELGMPKWELVLCLLAAWIIVALCMVKGVKSAGKAVYFTSLFPYLVLTILLIRGLTLDGSSLGLKYFFIPKWSRLADPLVWGKAATQVFFSLSSGWGGIIALSSYNKFNNNALLDSLIVSIGDGLTSVYAGMTVFCVLGYMSHMMSVPIDEVGRSGAGMAFVLYPDIVTSLPVSPLWAALFFAMLLTLGFGTMISSVNTVVTATCDKWPSKLSHGRRPLLVLIALCTVSFVIGLPCTTRGGMYVVQLLDNFCCTYTALLVCFLELIVLSWVYGVDKFLENVAEMRNGRPLPAVWKYIWKFFSPIILLAVAAFTFATIEPSKYGNYQFPRGADAVGACITVMILIPIPAIAIYQLYRVNTSQPLLQKIKDLCLPDRTWGREMGRKPAGFYASADPRHAFESQQPLTASFVNSSSTVGQDSHRIIIQ